MEFQKLLASRRSIRKFLSDAVSDAQITQLIAAAVTAPSGCNSQCWQFVAVRSPEQIAALADAVERGVRRFYEGAEEPFLSGRIKQTTFFKNAPLVILAYLTEMQYHDPRVTDFYAAKGIDRTEMLAALGHPDLLSVGAAIENLLLMAEHMGLGGCWMNDPVVAEQEISALFAVPPAHRLLSVIPIGRPAYTPREKCMKPMEDILLMV